MGKKKKKKFLPLLWSLHFQSYILYVVKDAQIAENHGRLEKEWSSSDLYLNTVLLTGMSVYHPL